jgi:hypothetical protein
MMVVIAVKKAINDASELRREYDHFPFALKKLAYRQSGITFPSQSTTSKWTRPARAKSLSVRFESARLGLRRLTKC